MKTKPLSSVHGFLSQPSARPFDFEIYAGTSCAVMGVSSSGKTRLLSELSQRASVHVHEPENSAFRASPQTILKRYGPDRSAEVLTALRLWDVRKDPIAKLGQTHRHNAQLLTACAESEGLVLLDGSLDALDLVTLPQVLGLLFSEGKKACVVVTQRPDVAESCESTLLLGPKGKRLSGTAKEIVDSTKPFRAVIEAQNSEAVASVAKKLSLSIQMRDDQIRVLLDEGLEQAAHLALEGYASIEAVCVRVPTFAEVIRDEMERSLI